MAQITALSPILQKVAIEELGEVATRIPEDLQALKTWIAQQPHLKARTDDQFLIQFLRGCKYSLERAKEKIDTFFYLKSNFPQTIATFDVDEPKFRAVHNLSVTSVLPKPFNGNGSRLVVVQFSYTSSEFDLHDVFRPFAAMHEVMMTNDPYACINGLVYIIDFAKGTASHYLQFTPTTCKLIVSFLEKSMPMRIKKVIYINATPAAQHVFRILLPLFSEKLRQRITIMGSDPQEWTQHIPLEYFPLEYGGQNGSLAQSTKDFNKTWDTYRDYFKENSNYGTNESLRPGKPLDFDGLFGVGGSFRKIIVD